MAYTCTLAVQALLMISTVLVQCKHKTLNTFKNNIINLNEHWNDLDVDFLYTAILRDQKTILRETNICKGPQRKHSTQT